MGNERSGRLRRILVILSLSLLLAFMAVACNEADQAGDAGGSSAMEKNNPVGLQPQGSDQDESPTEGQYDPATAEVPEQEPEDSKEMTVEDLVSMAKSDIDAFWAEEFANNGYTYNPAELVMVYEPIETGCGSTSSNDGPFYCPKDGTIYYPYDWVPDATTGAYLEEYGDFAVYQVLAHEIGHHVQFGMNELGVQNLDGLYTIQTELQADCFSGVFAAGADSAGSLENGDIDEALNILALGGDPKGTPKSDASAHGSAEERQTVFLAGYETGSVSDCLELGETDNA